MSNIGKGARQLYYDSKFGSEEDLPPATIAKFMFGDLIEALLLFLSEVAGHKVTERQGKVVIDQVVGHIDADIDGVTVDVKSASTYSFNKFKDGSLFENDSFGYVDQLAGYCTARGTPGAWLAMDKTLGHITYLELPEEYIKSVDVKERIKYLKTMVASETEPERCHPDEEYGKSGNRSLKINCSYCSHKFRCWSDANNGTGLRTFLYSSGPVYLTKVVNEPKVAEVFGKKER